MGITLAVVSLIHGLLARSAMLWGIICLVSIFLLGLTFVLRKKIKKPNWMKVHRILTIIMLVTFALHMVEHETRDHDYDHDRASIVTTIEEIGYLPSIIN